MKPINRVQEVINKYKLSVSAFEKKSGLSNGSIQTALKRETQLKDETLNSILTSFNEISAEWLLTGKGNMLKNSLENETSVQLIKQIPFYDVDFYSGFTQIFNDQTISPSYYFYLPEFIKAEFAIKNSGKSMAKELGCDDILGLREVKNWQDYFPQGEIYAVVTSNDLRTIKKVRKNAENTKLVLIPKPLDVDKFDYPDYEEVPINMVLSLFQVVASTHSKKLAL